MSGYQRYRYLFITKDPVHVGTGGYRLGRVDNSIVREPGTRVPKIPGTSLHGAARAYAARLYENPAAAGQSQDDVADPDTDPICYTFGYINTAGEGEEATTSAHSGVVNVFDAQVLLFPVHSLRGPVWVSTVGRLEKAGVTVSGQPETWAADSVLTTWDQTDALNLGWLMLAAGGRVTVTAPAEWQGTAWDGIGDRIVLVQETLFSQVANSNLEVRTSVSINPETGAAQEGALFTYEALPRATFLTGDVVVDDYRTDGARIFGEGITTTAGDNPLPGSPWAGPRNVFESGLGLMEWLGVGGMGTRGFGRIGVVGDAVEARYGQEEA